MRSRRPSATSGTAIVFAGGTVVIALVTLLVAGIPLVTSLGYASAFAVVTAVLASITLLPALLALLGRHIDSLALPAFLRRKPKPAGKGFWAAWARFVTGHPGRAILLALAILLPLMIPFFSLQLGQEDIGATPKDTTERQAYDLLASGFGPGYNGPLLVAVDLGTPAKPSADVREAVRQGPEPADPSSRDEQRQGESLADSLENSADEIKARLAAIQAEKDALKARGGLGLRGEKRRLNRSSVRLRKQRAVVKQLQGVVKDAAELAKLGGSLAAQAQQLAGELSRVQAAIRITQDQIARAPSPAEQAAPAAAARRPSGPGGTVDRAAPQHSGRHRRPQGQQADALKAQAARLRAKARRGIQSPGGLDDATQAVESALGSLASIGRKNKLTRAGRRARRPRSRRSRRTSRSSQAIQIEAKYQQQQAEKLKPTLTDELTLAGGDERGTDTRLVDLQDALAATRRGRARGAAADQQAGRRGDLHGDRHDRSRRRADLRAGRDDPRVRDPAVDGGHRSGDTRRRPDRQLRRPGRRDLGRSSSWSSSP